MRELQEVYADLEKTALPGDGIPQALTELDIPEGEDFYQRMPNPSKKEEPKKKPEQKKKEEKPKEKPVEKTKEKAKEPAPQPTEEDVQKKKDEEFEKAHPHGNIPNKPTKDMPAEMKKYTQQPGEKTKEPAPKGDGPMNESNPKYKSMFQRINRPVEKKNAPSKTQPKQKGQGGGGWQQGPKGGTFKVGPGGKKIYKGGELEIAYAKANGLVALAFEHGDVVLIKDDANVPDMFKGRHGTIVDQIESVDGRFTVRFGDGHTMTFSKYDMENLTRTHDSFAVTGEVYPPPGLKEHIVHQYQNGVDYDGLVKLVLQQTNLSEDNARAVVDESIDSDEIVRIAEPRTVCSECGAYVDLDEWSANNAKCKEHRS